jgi:serine/threonine-protein kinase
VYDSRADTVKLLIEPAFWPSYVPTGHIVFMRAGGLFAAPFDLGALEATGEAVPVLDEVSPTDFAISYDGTALYSVGFVGFRGFEVAWVDRSGQATPVQSGWTIPAPGYNWGMSLSPDRERLAIQIQTDLGGDDIWIKELSEAPPVRLTFHDGGDRMPRWSPDGQYVTFISSRRGGNFDLYRRRADNTGEAELLVDHQRSIAEGFYSPNGEWLVLRTSGTAGIHGGRDILGLRLGIDTVPIPLVATDADEWYPTVSPDGRWLAYYSDATGRDEVFVRPFPDTDNGEWQVSESGGVAPLWSQSGNELFFVNPDGDVMVAEVFPGPPFSVGERRALFRLGTGGMSLPQGISSDDERLLMLQGARAAEDETPDTPHLILVHNWFEELKVKMEQGR